jgi:hypothetical protein
VGSHLSFGTFLSPDHASYPDLLEQDSDMKKALDFDTEEENYTDGPSFLRESIP